MGNFNIAIHRWNIDIYKITQSDSKRLSLIKPNWLFILLIIWLYIFFIIFSFSDPLSVVRGYSITIYWRNYWCAVRSVKINRSMNRITPMNIQLLLGINPTLGNLI